MKIWRNNQFEDVELGEFHNLFSRWIDTFLQDVELQFSRDDVAVPQLRRRIWKDNVAEAIDFHVYDLRDRSNHETPGMEVRLRVKFPNGDESDLHQSFYCHKDIPKHVMGLMKPVADYLLKS